MTIFLFLKKYIMIQKTQSCVFKKIISQINSNSDWTEKRKIFVTCKQFWIFLNKDKLSLKDKLTIKINKLILKYWPSNKLKRK